MGGQSDVNDDVDPGVGAGGAAPAAAGVRGHPVELRLAKTGNVEATERTSTPHVPTTAS